MEFEATVKYQGYKAVYKIVPEQTHIFRAQMNHYSGSKDYNPPPSELIIIRGVRKWIGSGDNQELIDSLGEIIEAKMKSKDYLDTDRIHSHLYYNQNRKDDSLPTFGTSS